MRSREASGLHRQSRRAAALIAVALTVACGGASRGGAGGPRPAPGAPEATPADPLTTPWIVQRTGAPVTQTLHVAAVIEARVDSVATVDTIHAQLTTRWSLPSTGFPRRYLGSVVDYRLSRAMGDSLQVPLDVALPIAFTAIQSSSDGAVTFTVPDERACGDAGAVIVQGVRDLWLSLPDTLEASSTWSDSSRYVTCRDSIPLETTVHRTFRVTGGMVRDGGVVVTVERRTRTHIEGGGTQLGDSVTIIADGTGAAMFEVSLRTGAAVFASGESELRLTLRGSRRTQQLLQRSRISLLDQ